MRTYLTTKKNLRALITENIPIFLFFTLILYFSLGIPSFFSVRNFRNMLIQNSYLMVLTTGLFFIMVSGGIDLSAGYQISWITVFIGILMKAHFPTALIIILSLLMGAFCGLLNGLVITVFQISPFAATLGTQLAFKGFSYFISGGTVYTSNSNPFSILVQKTILRLPLEIWLSAACILFTAFFFSRTFLGCYMNAIGENEKAVLFSGIHVKRIKNECYVIGSLFFALVAIIIYAKQGIASPANGIGLEMTGITAVFLGGTAFYSGTPVSRKNRVLDTVLGTWILIIIENGAQLAGWNQYLQDFIKGFILIMALALNSAQKTAGKPQP